MVMFFAIIASMKEEVHMPIIGGMIENFTVINPAEPDVPHHMEGLLIGDIEPVEGDPESYESKVLVAETMRRKDGRTIMVGRIATISCRDTGEGNEPCLYIGPPEPNMPQSRKRA